MMPGFLNEKEKLSLFKRQEFELSRGIYGVMKVNGYVVGPWGIHQLRKSKLWEVVFIPTGNPLSTENSVGDAKALVSWIAKEHPALMKAKTMNDLRNAPEFIKGFQMGWYKHGSQKGS